MPARAFLVLMAAWVGLTPPLLLVFSHPIALLGIPVLYVEVFLVWSLVVVLGARASRHLRN